MMMSVIAGPVAAGNDSLTAFSARMDSGLLVGFPSVVSAPPRSAPIAATPTTTRTIQPPMVRHGWRALISASFFVENLIARTRVHAGAPVRIGGNPNLSPSSGPPRWAGH
jgi:hypothetical protein